MAEIVTLRYKGMRSVVRDFVLICTYCKTILNGMAGRLSEDFMSVSEKYSQRIIRILVSSIF